MADRDHDRERWQNEENESRNRDYDRGYGRSNYERGSHDRGYPGSDYSRDYGRDYGRSYNRGEYGSGTNRGFDRSGGYGRGSSYGSDWERGSYQPDFNRRSDQGWANAMDWDEEPAWTYSEYWWIVPGPYSGVGPRGYQRSDDRLCDEVCERMAQHGQLDASDIHVDIEKGEATLTGVVNNRREKRLAEDITESVFGVRDVHNQLRIKEQARSGMPAQERSRRIDVAGQRGMGNQGRAGQSTFAQNAGVYDAREQGSGSSWQGEGMSSRRMSAPRSEIPNTGAPSTGAPSTGGQRTGSQGAAAQSTGDQSARHTGSQEFGSYNRSPEGTSSSSISGASSRPSSSTSTSQTYEAVDRGPRSSQELDSQSLGPKAATTGTPRTGSSDQPGQTYGDLDTSRYGSSSTQVSGMPEDGESHTATTLPSGNFRSRVHPDMDVVDRQGDPIGKVKEVRQNDFLVDRPMARDVYVPFSACRSFEKEITLNIRDSEVDQQNWELSDLFGTGQS